MDKKELQVELGLRLGEISRRWRMALDSRLRAIGLTQAKWITLFHLQRLGDGQLQKELAQSIGIEGPTLVRVLDSLEHLGYIERREAPHDRRGKTIYLTAPGTAILRETQPISDELREQMLNDIPPADMRTCIHLFDRIMDNIRRLPKT